MATRPPPRRARRTPAAKLLNPHSLRHSFVTAALDAGVSLRDVQDAAGHADPRTMRRYDRARYNLDRHATYAVTAFLADDNVTDVNVTDVNVTDVNDHGVP